MIDVQELRKAYKRTRMDLGLTMGEAARLLDITVSLLSSIENGKPQELLRGEDSMEVVCHICGMEFFTNPVLDSEGKPTIFASYICPLCQEQEDEGGK
jgi:transcriptional regulator with XRE-family HTH domain